MLPQLDVDISNVDTTRAFIPDRTQVPCVIESAQVVENSKKTGHNLEVKVKTTVALEESTAPGKPVTAGYTLTTWYPLQVSEKQLEKGAKEDAWVDRLVEFIDTALGCSQGNRPSIPEAIESLPGKEVLVTVRLEETDDYGTQNRVGRIEPAA